MNNPSGEECVASSPSGHAPVRVSEPGIQFYGEQFHRAISVALFPCKVSLDNATHPLQKHLERFKNKKNSEEREGNCTEKMEFFKRVEEARNNLFALLGLQEEQRELENRETHNEESKIDKEKEKCQLKNKIEQLKKKYPQQLEIQELEKAQRLMSAFPTFLKDYHNGLATGHLFAQTHALAGSEKRLLAKFVRECLLYDAGLRNLNQRAKRDTASEKTIAFLIRQGKPDKAHENTTDLHIKAFLEQADLQNGKIILFGDNYRPDTTLSPERLEERCKLARQLEELKGHISHDYTEHGLGRNLKIDEQAIKDLLGDRIGLYLEEGWEKVFEKMTSYQRCFLCWTIICSFCNITDVYGVLSGGLHAINLVDGVTVHCWFKGLTINENDIFRHKEYQWALNLQGKCYTLK